MLASLVCVCRLATVNASTRRRREDHGRIQCLDHEAGGDGRAGEVQRRAVSLSSLHYSATKTPARPWARKEERAHSRVSVRCHRQGEIGVQVKDEGLTMPLPTHIDVTKILPPVLLAIPRPVATCLAPVAPRG